MRKLYPKLHQSPVSLKNFFFKRFTEFRFYCIGSDVVPNGNEVVQHSDSYFDEANESGNDDMNDENVSVNDDVRTIFSIQP